MKHLLTSQLRCLLVIGLIVSLGVGSTVIQVIAWATMIPTQLAETGSITQAVENTFNGQHACPMCKLAATKREAQQQENSPIPTKQKQQNKSKTFFMALDFPRFNVANILENSFPHPSSTRQTVRMSDSPDTPPPQLLG